MKKWLIFSGTSLLLVGIVGSSVYIRGGESLQTGTIITFPENKKFVAIELSNQSSFTSVHLIDVQVNNQAYPSGLELKQVEANKIITLSDQIDQPMTLQEIQKKNIERSNKKYMLKITHSKPIDRVSLTYKYVGKTQTQAIIFD
ncbi:hypothetical protein LZP85_11960 [Priestia flexa]|jgi:uncharacterized protein YlaN (UPF0358 family)|uniref:hypothetical protein n=1 Tax=Priestia flexa TaxID=86664 RepID=UPI001A8D3F7F|nr:hypothetical protein [Priestia flexa]MBN8436325.1 hypothetical protein [Priestia flexa]MCA0968910.1 hypothetical protein [Priestia flexa]UIR28701.1 hypothetical protein LZP85_11960 [Priestia flexa]